MLSRDSSNSGFCGLWQRINPQWFVADTSWWVQYQISSASLRLLPILSTRRTTASWYGYRMNGQLAMRSLAPPAPPSEAFQKGTWLYSPVHSETEPVQRLPAKNLAYNSGLTWSGVQGMLQDSNRKHWVGAPMKTAFLGRIDTDCRTQAALLQRRIFESTSTRKYAQPFRPQPACSRWVHLGSRMPQARGSYQRQFMQTQYHIKIELHTYVWCIDTYVNYIYTE